MPCDGWLGEPQFFSRFRKAQGFGDGDEIAQVRKFHRREHRPTHSQ